MNKRGRKAGGVRRPTEQPTVIVFVRDGEIAGVGGDAKLQVAVCNFDIRHIRPPEELNTVYGDGCEITVWPLPLPDDGGVAEVLRHIAASDKVVWR